MRKIFCLFLLPFMFFNSNALFAAPLSQEEIDAMVKQAEQGDDYAQYSLGNMYLYGVSVKTDYEKALKYTKMAWDNKYPAAGLDLGIMYLEGKGVEQDTEKAKRILTDSCDSGFINSCKQLDYLNGGNKFSESYEMPPGMEDFKD